jgi:dTDP-4-amino-4,6-dideoxygalactose transaminase
MIPINLPKIGDEEIQSVVEVMKSGMLTSGLGTGPKVTEFERNYSEFAGVNMPLLLTQAPPLYMQR